MSAANEELDEESLPKEVERLRGRVLFSEWAHLEPSAEQYVLLAVGALEQAQRFATLALYAQRRARAGE